MANAKKIFVDYSETGTTVYGIIRREIDSYRLNNADGTFILNPANPYLALSEDSVIKGRYEVSESRQIWNDGKYTSAIYRQIGGLPSPVNDTIIGSWEGWIYSDILYDSGLNAANLDATISSRATPAQVNTEVLDVLNTDTFAEPGQGAPGVTTTLIQKIGYIYKFLRNKITTTSTRVNIYDDAGSTIDQKSTISDDGTTFTRGEFGSGP